MVEAAGNANMINSFKLAPDASSINHMQFTSLVLTRNLEIEENVSFIDIMPLHKLEYRWFGLRMFHVFLIIHV